MRPVTLLAVGPEADPDGLVGLRRAVATASALAAMVLVVLDAAIANVALPTIGAALGVTPAAVVRVVTAYQLGLITALLPAAALGESFGYRKVFAAGAGVFTAASVLCALSPSLEILVAARFVQGLGGAAVMALGVALLRFSVPKERLGAAIGWNALAVALPSAVGPTLGAAILSLGSWPWLFVVNLPIALAVLLGSRALPIAGGTGRPVDLVGVALSACTFGALVTGAELAPRQPVLATVLFVGAAAYAAVLVTRDSRRASPLIPVDLLRNRSFRVPAVASVLCFTAQGVAVIALPFHFQHALGLSPVATGLCLAAWPLAVAVAGPLAGALANRTSSVLLCLTGGVFLAAGLAAGASLSLQAGPLALSACSILCGVGFGLFNVPNNRSMFQSAPRDRSSAAGGMQGIARLSGQTAGATAMVLLFEVSALDVAPRIGLALGAVSALAAGLVSLVARRATDGR